MQKQRIEQLQQWLMEEEINTAIITSSENVFYFSNFFSDPHERLLAIVFTQKNDPFLICPLMEVEQAKQGGFPYTIIGYRDTENPWEIVTKEVQKRTDRLERIAVEKTHMNIERYEILLAAFPNAKFIAAEEKLQQLRLIKDEKELEYLRKAAELADFAIQVGIHELKEGITELEIIAAIEYEMKKKGVENMSFPTTVLFGSNAASPHGNPGLTKLKKGDFVLFDLGVIYKGYASDITRTIAFGEVDEEKQQIYEIVRKAQEAAVRLSKPGVTCAELDRTARNIIEEAGYGEYFTHRLGHGLGISIHEFPSINELNPLPLQKGMVFTIEPGIYIPDKIGVRIEDDVYISDDGSEVLTKFTKQLQMIS